MKRRPVPKGKSRRLFKKTAGSRPINRKHRPITRGGIRL